MTGVEHTDPEWLTVGAKVAVIDGRGLQNSATLRTVAKLTRRDVVLDNGVRFNRSSLRESGNHYGDEIRAVDDPSTVAILTRMRRESAAFKVEQAMRAWRNTGDDAHAEDARDILTLVLKGGGTS